MQTFQSSWASGIQKHPKLKNATIFRPFPSFLTNILCLIIWQLITIKHLGDICIRFYIPIFIVRLNAICYKLLLLFTFYLCKTQKDKCLKHWLNLQGHMMSSTDHSFKLCFSDALWRFYFLFSVSNHADLLLDFRWEKFLAPFWILNICDSLGTWNKRRYDTWSVWYMAILHHL